MHILAFMYPNEPGAKFDKDHFLKVHLPLGLGLTAKHLGLKPQKVVLYTPTRGADGQSESARYCAISSVFFNTEAEVGKFSGLFDVEEAARRLSEDFPNYTPHPPEIVTGEVTEITDIDGMIRRFETELTKDPG